MVVVAVLSAYHLSTFSELLLAETRSRAVLLKGALFQAARFVVTQHPQDPYGGLRADTGIRSILNSSLDSEYLTFAAIVDPAGVAVVHAVPGREGKQLDPLEDLDGIVNAGPITQLRAVLYSDRTFELREAILIGDDNKEFGSIR